jgi:glycosyltransferase involved in cell wall biosynthesis
LADVRVLFLNPVARIGGAEQSLLDLLSCLRNSATLGLLTLEEGPLVARARDLGVQTTVVPLPGELMSLGDAGTSPSMLRVMAEAARNPLSGIRAVRTLSMAIAAFKPSIVHSNGIKTHLLSGLASTGDARLVWHVRDFLGSRPVVRALIPRVSSRVSATFAISGAVEQDIRKVLPLVPTAVVYNAVDIEKFRPREAPRGLLDSLAGLPPAPVGTVRIGLVATYAIWKGHRLFLEAASLALRRSPVPVRFYVVGGPIYLGAGSQVTENDLRAWVHQLELEDVVGVVPFVENPESVFNDLEIAVSANTSPEPFGRTVVEALASGVPVVTGPDVGALEDLPAGAVERLEILSAETLAAALVSLASDGARRAELGRQGIAAAQRYSRERLRERVLDLYCCLGVPGARA